MDRAADPPRPPIRSDICLQPSTAPGSVQTHKEWELWWLLTKADKVTASPVARPAT